MAYDKSLPIQIGTVPAGSVIERRGPDGSYYVRHPDGSVHLIDPLALAIKPLRKDL